jgi:LPS-assembly protein
VLLNLIKILLMIIICQSINADYPNEDLDWLPQNNHLCGGCYIEPKYPLEITKNLPVNTIVINANKNKLTKTGSIYSGNVVIAQNNQQLIADEAVAKHNAKGEIELFKAFGNVILTEPGIRIIGTKAEYIPPKKYKIIHNANYRIYNHHSRGVASNIEVFDNGIISLPNASYTTCQPKNNTWNLKSKKMILNKNTGRGESWHTTMYVNDVPVFYLPYFNFPIDNKRKTGFLTPIFGSNSRNGFNMGVPFYWNMAENYDYTVTPVYMSKRGLKFDNKFRYLTTNSSGSLQFNFLPKDSSYNKFRYAVWFKNKTNINKNWNLSVKYNKVRDNNYLYDFGKDLGQTVSSLEEGIQNSSVHLEQSAKLENINQYGVFKFRVLQYQTVHPTDGPLAQEQYKKMPEISWNSNYIYLNQQYRFKYGVNYTDFKLRKIDPNNIMATGSRVHFLPSIERPYYTAYGYLNPRIQIDTLSYQKLSYQKLNNNSNISRVIPVIDLNSGLNFTKNLSNNMEQTLEPKLYYLYIPKIEQQRYPIFDTSATEFSYDQLFRYNRYNGPDRLADANQVTFGVKSGFYQDGEEKAAIKIARARYFRELTPYLGEPLGFGKWSPIAIALNYQFNQKICLLADLVRQKLNQTRSSTFSMQYKFTEQQIINVGYRYAKFVAVPERQAQTSVSWAINDSINLLGKLDYDLHQKRPVYSLAGVEINKCCIILRFAVARSLLPTENLLQKRYNNKFLAQIVFKGLSNGTIGSLGSNYISSKIPGYMAKEKF